MALIGVRTPATCGLPERMNAGVGRRLSVDAKRSLRESERAALRHRRSCSPLRPTVRRGAAATPDPNHGAHSPRVNQQADRKGSRYIARHGEDRHRTPAAPIRRRQSRRAGRVVDRSMTARNSPATASPRARVDRRNLDASLGRRGRGFGMEVGAVIMKSIFPSSPPSMQAKQVSRSRSLEHFAALGDAHAFRRERVGDPDCALGVEAIPSGTRGKVDAQTRRLPKNRPARCRTR